MSHLDGGSRILVISLSFVPDAKVGGKRFSFLSRIWEKKFSDLHVLTLKEKYYSKVDHYIESAGIVHRTGIYPAYQIEANNIISRKLKRLWVRYLCLIDPFSGWILPAVYKGLKIIKKNRINLIIATGPPFSAMVVGLLLNIITRTKLVLDYRDPWFEFYQKKKLLFRKTTNVFFEKIAIGRASTLVFCSRIMMENFRGSLGKYTKATYHVVTNGYQHVGAVKPVYIENSKKSMVYAGNFYGERGIRLVANSLSRLIDEGVIEKQKFCFSIFGNLRNDDMEVIRKYDLEKIIKQRPWMPYNQIIRYLKGADILFLPSGSDVRYAIPYKFFDYLSVKRPIFAVAPQDSSLSQLMEQIDCGRFALINDKESVITNLRAIILENREYTFFGAEKYSWEQIGKKYSNIISQVLSCRELE